MWLCEAVVTSSRRSFSAPPRCGLSGIYSKEHILESFPMSTQKPLPVTQGRCQFGRAGVRNDVAEEDDRAQPSHIELTVSVMKCRYNENNFNANNCKLYIYCTFSHKTI